MRAKDSGEMTARPAVRPVTPPAAHASRQVRELLALQRAAGNAAVVETVQRAGHRHGPGCGHGAVEEPSAQVQRSAVHEVLRSPGRPMDDGVRTDMESRFGTDFSDVRIHDNAAAQTSAAQIGARAYTSGHHVVIGRGGGDAHTLAHELTHVVQQRRGPVAGTDNGSGLSMSDPSDRFERAAEDNARRVMQAPVQKAVETGVPTGVETAGQSEGHSHHHAPGAGTAAIQRAPAQTIGKNVEQGLGAYSQQIAQLAEKVGTSGENVLNALLDPAYDPMGAHDIAPQILDSNLKDPIEYAACFPTAHALFPVLTDPAANPPAHGPNPDKAADLHEFQAAVGTLTESIREAWTQGLQSVFRIEYAGHGFTLVLRRTEDGDAHIELIESLAHAAGIIPSLTRPGMGFEHVVKALTQMASGDVNERVAGAGALGWNAHALYLGNPQPTEQERFPQTRMKWWRQPLSDKAGENWFAQFRLRFNFVARTYGSQEI
ncbi:DUF4157 domain-containing protein [Streptomyces sp. TP-A0356]|uniref:eCIS core domain-containing protein n=1 Tax=Streptomyces sp. TP-A0356 TaxID=1359208 RepID=UPI000B03E429|nr:DUF4157 domain-containing protein [Streptomyces sp. TP-A0356]